MKTAVLSALAATLITGATFFATGVGATVDNISSMLIVVEIHSNGEIVVRNETRDWACTDVPGIPNASLAAGLLCEQ